MRRNGMEGERRGQPIERMDEGTKEDRKKRWVKVNDKRTRERKRRQEDYSETERRGDDYRGEVRTRVDAGGMTARERRQEGGLQ